MSQFLAVHPEHPQPRLVKRAAEILAGGGVVAYPTDSTYALACRVGDKAAVERICRIRRLDRDHLFTLVCHDLSHLATYARVDNTSFRFIRHHIPGPYTFVLRATREAPRRLVHPRRRTIGLRVPESAIVRALIETHQGPLISTSLLLPGDEAPLTNADSIRERLERDVDAIIDGGHCGVVPTTVVDLTTGEVNVVREGLGELT
ncbi:MAG: threonylcarbamoyl-AMP synthase [Gammaproteobacteria bacterium]|nr:threonylcarbamoyl-AMP synthase [Gammaproteobacteria bacterium]MYB36414.1 threonylcarbamoyl-AMP synthase [Gammaproteobacteria bacterium]